MGTFWNPQFTEMESLVSRIKAVCPESFEAALGEVDRRCRERGCGTVAALRSVYSDLCAARWSPPQ